MALPERLQALINAILNRFPEDQQQFVSAVHPGRYSFTDDLPDAGRRPDFVRADEIGWDSPEDQTW